MASKLASADLKDNIQVEFQELSYQAQSIVNSVMREETSIDDLEDALCDEAYTDEHPAIREALTFLEDMQQNN